MRVRLEKLAFMLLLSLCIGLLACTSQADKASQALRSSEAIMGGYFQGSANEARGSLHRYVAFLEKDALLEPTGRAQLLVLAYQRLYVLEKRERNDPASEAALIGMEYWALRKADLLRVSAEEAMKDIKATTPDRIVEIVDRADQKFMDGGKPRYVASP